eukprot:3976744-Karenia_brevis.AAC.1
MSRMFESNNTKLFSALKQTVDERTSRVEKKVASLEDETTGLKAMLAKQAAEIRAIKNQLLIDASREAN